MEWIRENSAFLLFFILFVAMNLFATACTEDMADTAKKGSIRIMKAMKRKGATDVAEYTGGELVIGDFYGNQFHSMRTLRAGHPGSFMA